MKATIDPQKLKPHSLRYEEIIRKNKDDLKRKRSLAHITDETAEKVELLERGPTFKSRLHSEVRLRNKQAKEQSQREFEIKLQLQDKAKNYSKNVKEMYMPPPKLVSNRLYQD